MTTVKIFAPAKINLTLHITGQRDDGYHQIDSLVVFAPIGDRLTIDDANTRSLTVEGPEAAGVPGDMSNLALQAAAIFEDDPGVSLVLKKSLPAASGIGGGSADAAAVVRGMALRDPALRKMDWHMPSDDDIRPIANRILALGADVPMCLLSSPCRVRGIGEKVELFKLPPLPAILVNPRVPVPTAQVFAALEAKTNPPMPEKIPAFADVASTIDWLCAQRNDLETPAIRVEPAIAEVLSVLRETDGCGLARMSGSGATCFGLFDSIGAAQRAGETIRAAYPKWWIAGGLLGDQSAVARPGMG